MRVLWILALAAGCQPTYVTPDALEAQEGRSLFAEDSASARALAERLATEHATSSASRLFDALPEARNGLAARSVRIARGGAHVRLDQTVDGVPVFGAQAIVHLDGEGEVRGVTDRWHRDLAVDTDPTWSSDDAVAAAEAREGLSLDAPETALFVLRHRGEDRLVWRVRLNRLDGSARSSVPVVFVDAHTGEVVRRYDDLQTVSSAHTTTDYNGDIVVPVEQVDGLWHLRSSDDGVATYDLQGSSSNWITSSALHPITSDTVDGFTDTVALDAHFGAVQTQAYYASMHARDGIDGNGGPNLKDGLTSSGVHFGTSYVNAFWSGSAMVYGDGDGWTAGPLTSLDIAAHEMTHGVTQHTAGLIYEGESGALNEAMSDIFAALVEQWVEGDGDDRWRIGEACWTPHVAGDALRDMTDPTTDGDSRDHYSSRYTGMLDNGGVHWNSGIANLFFHLLVEGGQHPDPAHRVATVQGIGFDAAGAIAYAALSEHLTPSAGFFDARAAFLAAATDLHGADSAEWAAVANAWAEVGVGLPADGTLPDDPEPPADVDVATALNEVLAGDKGDRHVFALDVPAGASTLVVRLAGGSGDADLYLRHGAEPTASGYDCRPYLGGNEEVCEIADPAAGTWYVAVEGFLAYADVQLLGEVVVPQTTPAEPEGLDLDLAGDKGSEQTFALDVPAGASRLTVTLSGGTGDADLYVNAGSSIATNDWDCRPYQGGNEETCTFDAPAAGPWRVLVHGYAAFDAVALTATVD